MNLHGLTPRGITPYEQSSLASSIRQVLFIQRANARGISGDY